MTNQQKLQKALNLIVTCGVPPCDHKNQDRAVHMIERMIATQEEMAEFLAMDGEAA